jgi:hypothetical protein
MSDPRLTMLSIPMDATPQDFANQVYRQVFVPLIQAYAQTQTDPINAFVGALCSMSGCIVGSIAAATTPGYAAELLRAAADSCDQLPNDPPPHPAPDGARTH